MGAAGAVIAAAVAAVMILNDPQRDPRKAGRLDRRQGKYHRRTNL